MEKMKGLATGAMTHLNELGKDNRKCPKHRTWMRKGQCEPCLMEADKLQAERDKQNGVTYTPVVIRKI